VAKRAKRASHVNPRQDRNFPKYAGFKSSRGYQNYSDNVIDFPNLAHKRQLEIIPRNLNQETLMAQIEGGEKDVIFAIGPAGCGKTLISTLEGIRMLKTGEIRKFVITRPNVAVDDKDIGFLPGTQNEKMLPWTLPVLDVFAEYFSQREITNMIDNGTIELIPMAYLRGRSFKHSFILLDEAQNTTPSSMLSALTRIGEGSKMVITGDVKQSDRGSHNGLSDFLDRFEESSHIGLVLFDRKDIERHPVINEILSLYGQN
jgi:phosphate starvation-inducible PhoH-like protein